MKALTTILKIKPNITLESVIHTLMQWIKNNSSIEITLKEADLLNNQNVDLDEQKLTCYHKKSDFLWAFRLNTVNKTTQWTTDIIGSYSIRLNLA